MRKEIQSCYELGVVYDREQSPFIIIPTVETGQAGAPLMAVDPAQALTEEWSSLEVPPTVGCALHT